MYKQTLILVLLGFSILGCGGGGGGDDDSIDRSLAAIYHEVRGLWVNPCSEFLIDDNPLINKAYIRTTIELFNDTYTAEGTAYLDDKCENPVIFLPRANLKGRFVVGDTLLTPDGEAYEVNLIVEESSGLPPLPGSFGEYNIFALQSGKLYFGDLTGTNDGSSPSLRPTLLNTDIEFRR